MIAESPPLVSVVIPAFNAKRTIQRALDSVALQNWQPLEVIVVDDASTDGTADAVEDLAKSGVRLVRMSRNGGASAARNHGIRAAAGKYVAFLDADDTWLPEKLRHQIAALEANSRMSIVTCNSILVNAEGEVVRESHQRYAPVAGAEAWKTLLAYNFIPTPTVVARKDRLMEAGEFNTALPLAEDLDMWIRLALLGEVGVLPQVLVKIHDMAGSLSKRHVHEEQSLLLPLLRGYIRNQRHRLSHTEIRGILGQRFFAWGAYQFHHARYKESVGLFARAAWNRHRVLKSSVTILRASILAVFQAGNASTQEEKWAAAPARQTD